MCGGSAKMRPSTGKIDFRSEIIDNRRARFAENRVSSACCLQFCVA